MPLFSYTNVQKQNLCAYIEDKGGGYIGKNKSYIEMGQRRIRGSLGDSPPRRHPGYKSSLHAAYSNARIACRIILMLALHVVGLVFAIKTNKIRTGHIMGIVCSAIAWIPIVGMIMHILTAIFLLIEAAKDNEPSEDAA